MKVADDKLLNKSDEEGLSPLENALLVGCSRCQKRSQSTQPTNGRHCRRCEGYECAGILIDADCAVPARRLQYILHECPSRCRLRYMRAIKDRRDRLKQLALEHLSAEEAGSLGLFSDAVLDFYAPRAIKLLEQRRIRIPEALKIGFSDKDLPVSIYGKLAYAPHAALFWRLGFHDTSSWLKEEPEILRWPLPKPIRYLEWLDNHGLDVLSLNGKGLTAHSTFHQLGFLLYESNVKISPEWAQKLQVALLSPDLVDACQCRCSTNSCTPLTYLLKGITKNYHWRGPFFRQSWFHGFLDLFGTHLDLRHHLACLRFLTFAALDIPHTCCELFPCKDVSAEDVEEIQNEHEYELGLLEELLEELGVQMREILHDSDRGLDDPREFWERTWVSRVTETLRHLDGSDVSDTERQRAEEIGVVWEEASSPESTENDFCLEYWVEELEKIEAECA